MKINHESLRELDLRSRDAIIDSTAAIFWGDETMVHNNGSAFFIESGKQIFCVTAGHVYEHYLKIYDRRKLVSPCRVNSFPFNPIERLIDLGTDGVDIATFEITREELGIIDRFPSPWPAVVPQEGEFVLFCGLPGSGRNQVKQDVSFKYFVGKLTIENVSLTTFSFQRPPNDTLVDITGRGMPPEDLKMGGMSGGPMFVLRDGEMGKQWMLAGLVSEGHPTFPIIISTRADLIRDDGTIKKPL